jgi:phosphoglycerate dehydrogenase-like enzyme
MSTETWRSKAMAEIKKALVTVQLKPENMGKVRAALAGVDVTYLEPGDIEGIRKCCADVDVAIFNSDSPVPVSELKSVKWIHCSHAGVDKTATKELFDRGIVLTCAKGRSAKALAEHALMFMMAFTYNLKGNIHNQDRHIWGREDVYPLGTGLYEKTIGIVGLGNTGLQVARLAKTFDMKVLGYRKSARAAENVDQVYASDNGDDLKDMLSRCDFVVLCIELNDSTYHIIGDKELSALKKTAVLVNMGRGKLVDEAALVRLLKDRTFFGAGLDTVETEPLPADSPLWDLDNVILTPHMTPAQPDKDEIMLSYILKNIEAYRRGEGYVNRVSEGSLFTVNR